MSTNCMTVKEIQKRLRRFANKDKAKILQGFFKTGPGEYGEGDVFLGVTVPVLRKLAIEFKDASAADAVQLLKSAIHEERLLALLLLVRKYEMGDDALKKKICALYLKSAGYINNWDLVDLSAPNIVGNYLMHKSRKPLYGLAKSRNLWKRRIAIMSTFTFIRRNDFSDALKIAKMLLHDDEDLIHKAAGWMLREAGKRDVDVLEKFLKKHYRIMPRTMLRYAIEKFTSSKRWNYLSEKV